MLRKCYFMFAVTLLLWSSMITLTYGENILFLNLFKDEELSENIDSNLESDLISSYSLDEANESIVLTNDKLKNLETELVGLSKSENKGLVNQQVSSTSPEAMHLQSSPVTEITIENKTALDSKQMNNENSHFNIFSKDPVEEGTSARKGVVTVLPERSVEGELNSFVSLCFDIIASFIQGVMRGIMFIGENSTNSKPTETFSDYGQSPSRIKKRDLPSTEKNEALQKTEPNRVESPGTNKNEPKGNLTNTLAQHYDSVLAQNHTANMSTKHSTESTATSDRNKSLNETKKTTTEVVTDVPLSDSSSALEKDDKERNGLIFTKTFNHNFSELKNNVPEEIEKETHLSTPNNHLHRENIWTHSRKEGQDLNTPFGDLTSDDNSNYFLLNDFINKQNDPRLKEIIEKQFASARLYPQPHEDDYQPAEETSTGTIIMAAGAVFVVLVLAFVGLAAAYRLRLFSIGGNRFGNRNPSSQHNTMYMPPMAT